MSPTFSAEVATVLRRYSSRLDNLSDISLAATSGFSGAGVWKVDAPSGCWAARRWPSPGLPETRLRGLHRLLEHLHCRGLTTVAVPLAADSGETLVSDGSSWWQVEPWLPGQADYHAHPSPSKLTAALTELARWHRAAAEFTPAAEHQAWFASKPAAESPAIGERGDALQRLSRAAFSEMQRLIEASAANDQRSLCRDLLQQIQQQAPIMAQELSPWRRKKFRLQPCLRDVWHDHVLFTGEMVTGLIDPSACRTEHVAADLSRLIGSLVEDDDAGWRTALDAYQRIRPLSLEELALVTVLDRTGVVLSAWTWLDWIYIQRRRFDNPDKVQERLHHFRRRMQAMSSRTGIFL